MKRIFIERDILLLRIAVYENDVLENLFFEIDDGRPKEGYIYLGEVKNILPSLKGAFLDIGCSKNVFLYLDKNAVIKKGDRLAVQIIKEEEGEKSAKASLNLLIPGRFIMLETLNKRLEFSKKLSAAAKDEIKEKIKLRDQTGAIVRTNSNLADPDEVQKEYESLYEIYDQIEMKKNFSSKLGCLNDFKGILGKALRDIDLDIEYILVNNYEDKNFIDEYFNGKIKSDYTAKDLFLSHGIEKDIKALLDREVPLPSKGNIIIDKTEAMYVIDVNSSKNIRESSIDKTAFKTNMEAALEIPRQIKLRGLSGIIIIDFIDLKDKSKKDELLKVLKEGFEDDRFKPSVYPFTELNLVQITRKKVRSVSSYLQDYCSFCTGGKILSALYLSVLINGRITFEDIKNPVIEVKNIYKNKEEELQYYLKLLIGENFNLIFNEQSSDFLIKRGYPFTK